MKVLKFGGTSVGTIESLTNVKKIVSAVEEPAVVVVSALGGLTDKLIGTANKAASGDESYKEDVDSIIERHHNVISGVVEKSKAGDCLDKVDELLLELRKLYAGVFLIKDLPQKTLDNILSFGERMSSIIVTSMIPGAVHADSLKIVKTEKWFGKNIGEISQTTANILETIKPAAGKPVIIGGFISTDKDTGEITNLGRGGSDYTAALIAAALNADILEIWTDVDGFMTSDPRIIKEARIIPEMSFVESMELCSFGAKVIYPPTIYPVFHKNIPIKILNTFNPEAPGTLVKEFDNSHWGEEERVRGLSVLKGAALINIRGAASKNIAAISSRTFNALAHNGISVFLVSPSEDNNFFSFTLKEADCEDAIKKLKEEFAPETSTGQIESIDSITGLSIIAIVGDNVTLGNPVSPRIYNTLMRNSIEPKASSEGASKTTITFVVEEQHANDALTLIHSLFF